jgi:hypothetical protein
MPGWLAACDDCRLSCGSGFSLERLGTLSCAERAAAIEWCEAGLSAPPEAGNSTKARSRGNTQAGRAARPAGKDAKRESIQLCRIACLSRCKRREGIRFTFSP